MVPANVLLAGFGHYQYPYWTYTNHICPKKTYAPFSKYLYFHGKFLLINLILLLFPRFLSFWAVTLHEVAQSSLHINCIPIYKQPPKMIGKKYISLQSKYKNNVCKNHGKS